MGPEHRYRFTTTSRLKDAASYGRVFKKARRSRDKWFTVLCRRRPVGPARLGLAISKKHCKRATGRNRIKRVIRESFRRSQRSLSGLDIVVINQPAAADASNAILFESLAGHWQRCQQTE
ncbi:MAG: ribonuclease P protein component [Pseudomonadota bacterium]